jgi:hypothetical protein
MLNCFTKSLPNCCAKWIFGIILRQIAAPNQYLQSICAKNVRQILFESLFCAEDLSEIHPQIHPGKNARGPTRPHEAYEISKSRDFQPDFLISNLISDDF